VYDMNPFPNRTVRPTTEPLKSVPRAKSSASDPPPYQCRCPLAISFSSSFFFPRLSLSSLLSVSERWRPRSSSACAASSGLVARFFFTLGAAMLVPRFFFQLPLQIAEHPFIGIGHNNYSVGSAPARHTSRNSLVAELDTRHFELDTCKMAAHPHRDRRVATHR